MNKTLCVNNRDIPQDMILGNLVFMNLTDMKIPQTDLANIFANNNIPQTYIRKIFPADTFRRATSYPKGRSVTIKNANGDLISVKIEVDEVKCNNNCIKRIVGIKSVNQLNEKVNYDPVAMVFMDRNTSSFNSYVTVAGNNPNVSTYQAICDEMQKNYNEWLVYHNKTTIRNLINRIVADTHPVNLMPTGLCKFTPISHSDLIYNLKSALKEMDGYRQGNDGKNIMEIIPVVDTDEQRNMVQKNMTVEVTNELADFVSDLREIIQTKQTISTRTAKAYIDKFNFLREKVKDYEQLLGIYVTSIGSQITAALKLVNDNMEVTA